MLLQMFVSVTIQLGMDLPVKLVSSFDLQLFEQINENILSLPISGMFHALSK